MFIIMSFSYGLAVYLLVLIAAYRWSGTAAGRRSAAAPEEAAVVFVAAVLYFVAVYHLTNLYFAKQQDFERFILVDGGIYPHLFWVGQIALGSLLPLAILLHPRLGKSRALDRLRRRLVVLGGFAQMYVTIIGGQAYPLDLFPGHAGVEQLLRWRRASLYGEPAGESCSESAALRSPR